MFKPSLAGFVVAAGLLAAPGPAPAAVVYNGHAGLGANAYEHNQTDLELLLDGTSNTLQFGELA